MRRSALTIRRNGRRILRAVSALGLSLVVVLSLVAVIDTARPALVSASTSVTHDAGTGVYESGAGTYPWSSPGNVTADDTSYAEVIAGPAIGLYTYYLEATNYGFSIPSDATINGIEVKIGRYASGIDIRDYVVRLVKGGSITGDNKAATGTTWPTGGIAEATYGGASALWGTTWAYSDVNSSNFGVVLSATNDDATAPNTYVDYMQISVTYTPTPPSITKVATLYNSSENATVTQMTPQLEYAVKVTVADAGTIDYLNTVTVTVFYDSNSNDSAGDIPAANTQTSFIITCTVGGANGTWTHDPNTSTTWDMVEADCKQPSLTAVSGDFWFHFEPGKVATEADDWDVYVSVTDDSSYSDTWYDASNCDMLWYGEIDVSGTAPNWGNVLPGMDFTDDSAKESVTANYISNGNYDAAVTTAATWGSSSTLNTAGTPGANEFSLKAWSSDNLTAADLVTTVTGDCVIDNAGDLTTESGDTNAAITLYLKLGLPFSKGSYSGDITFYVRHR